jgi:hypothetical protein
VRLTAKDHSTDSWLLSLRGSEDFDLQSKYRCKVSLHVPTQLQSSSFRVKNICSYQTFNTRHVLKGAGLAQAVYSVWLRAGRLGDLSSIPGRGERIFPVSSVSRPALGPTQPPVQSVPGVLSPGLKRGRGVMLTTHSHLVPRS